MYKPVDREYIIGGDIASDNIFDHDDHHHQEQQLRIDSYGDDDHSSNTADHSPPEYARGSDDEGDFDRDAGDEAIGPSSKDVTKGAVLYLIFALLVKHRLSKGCLGDLFELLNIVVPSCVPKTTYFFDKMFFSDMIVKTHFYCPNCQSYLGEPSPILFCELCQTEFEEESLLKSKCFFFSSSIGDQLKTILEKDGRVWDKICSNKLKSLFQDGTLKGEIYTGDMYKTHEIRKFFFLGIISPWQWPQTGSIHSNPLD